MATLTKRSAADVSGTPAPSPKADIHWTLPDSGPEQERHAMIAEAAFFIAMSRGFAPGSELDDWLAAERQFEHRE